MGLSRSMSFLFISGNACFLRLIPYVKNCKLFKF